MGLLNRIRHWLWLRKVIRLKQRDLWGAEIDKFYFETEMADRLSYVDDNDRKALAEEHNKPHEQQDRVKIEELENRISEAKAVKAEYRKLKMFIADTNLYLKTLRKWQQSQN